MLICSIVRSLSRPGECRLGTPFDSHNRICDCTKTKPPFRAVLFLCNGSGGNRTHIEGGMAERSTRLSSL